MLVQGTQVYTQNPHGGSQGPTTPATENLVPSPGLLRLSAHKQCTETCAGKTLIHAKLNIKKKKKRTFTHKPDINVCSSMVLVSQEVQANSIPVIVGQINSCGLSVHSVTHTVNEWHLYSHSDINDLLS